MSQPVRIAGRNASASVNPSYELIVGAARDLFIERGYPNVSMDLIARRADVVRATVYNNFRDKEAILVAILARYQQGYAAIPDRLRPLAEGDPSSFELIEATIREAFEWRLANRQLRPVIDLAKSLPASAAWNAAGAAADDVVRGWLLTIHRRDARRGLLREGLRLKQATAALWGMVDAALPAADALTTPAAVSTTVRELALLHWYAIYRVEPDLPTNRRRRRRAQLVVGSATPQPGGVEEGSRRAPRDQPAT